MLRQAVISSVSVLVLGLLAAPAAFAGFEFVSPPSSSAASVAPAPIEAPIAPMVRSAPVAAIQSDALPNVAATGGPVPLGTQAIPYLPLAKDADALKIESGKPKVAAASGPVVEGFGRNVPLAIALQQIVPPSYRYSFEPPVNPSMRISWTGDKPWKEVVADISRTYGMNADIASNVIVFSRPSPVGIALGQSAFEQPKDDVQGMPLKPLDSMSPPKSHGPDMPASAKKKVEEKEILVAGSETIQPKGDIQNMLFDNGNVPLPKGAEATTPSATHSIPAKAPVIADTALDMPVDSTLPAPLALPKPSEKALVAAAPVPATGNSDIHKMLFDNGASPAPIAAQAPVATDLPPVVAQANIKPVPMAAEASSSKSAFFDGLMDEAPAKTTVKEKTILTASDNSGKNVMLHDAKKGTPEPLDLLKKPAVSTSRPNSVAQGMNPTVTKTEITKQIDNPIVASNDLPPSAMAAPVVEEIAPVQADLTTIQDWTASKGQTLRQILTTWAEQSGSSLVWSSEYDYPLQTDIRIKGNYSEAVRTVLAGFAKAQPRPIGRLFKNDQVGAQPVLIVETQRLTN